MKTVAGSVPRSLSHCISRLDHGLKLAQLALAGAEPEDAARYILAALKAVRPDLRSLKRNVPAET